MVDEVYCNKNKNNVNGAYNIGECKIFYKILSSKDYERELQGYDLIKDYYKVPKRYFSYIDKEKGYVGYEFLNEIKLLFDYFLEHVELDFEYSKVISIYKNVFWKSIKYKLPTNSALLFEDRIDTRLKDNIVYLKNNNYDGLELTILDNKIKIDLYKMHSEIIKYFQSFSKHWCIISQCDPNDMNICMDGTMFDYTAGGYVPLMAEYATYFWYNFGQAEMLSIKYNKNAFRGYENIQDILKNDVIVKNNEILYLPRKIRMDAIIYYTKNIMKPILDNIDNKTWYTEFKNYLAMKILAVFDFSILKREDILFSISFLQLLYNKNIVFIDELINLLEGWKCWYD